MLSSAPYADGSEISGLYRDADALLSERVEPDPNMEEQLSAHCHWFFFRMTLAGNIGKQFFFRSK